MYSLISGIFLPLHAEALMTEPPAWLFFDEWGLVAGFFWGNEAPEGGEGSLTLFWSVPGPPFTESGGGAEANISVPEIYAPGALSGVGAVRCEGVFPGETAGVSQDGPVFTHDRGRVFKTEDKGSAAQARGTAARPGTALSRLAEGPRFEAPRLSGFADSPGGASETAGKAFETAEITGTADAERALERIETMLARAYRGMLF